MQKLLAIFKLKLLLLRDNWSMLLMMTLSPILFTLIIGGMNMGGSNLVPVYIADQDQSAFSAQLIESFDPKVYSVQKLSEEAIFEKVENNEITIGYIIPRGMGTAIERGAQGTVLVVKQPKTVASNEIQTLLNSAALRILSSKETTKSILKTVEMYQGATEPAFQEKVAKAATANVETGWTNRQLSTNFVSVTSDDSFTYDPKAQSSMGFLIFFLMFTLTFGINEILNDKRLGTWSRVLSTPTRSWQLLGGHFLGTMFIGAIQVVLLVGFGYFFMGVQWGRAPLGVFLILFALIFALTSLGLMLAGFVQSNRQLQALYPVLIVSTSMLGGCMWPLEIVPDFMKTVAYFIPQGQAMMGLTDLIVRGAGIGETLVPLLSLLGMGIIFFSIGVTRVQKEA